MKTHALPDWQAFELKMRQLCQETQVLKQKQSLPVTDLLFRGQRNSHWHLETTLDREHPCMSLGQYLGVLERVHARIKDDAPERWPHLEEEINGLRQRGLESIRLLPTKESGMESILSFMAYLRHHGFPSPLLDWSRSPYVAAFFAFEWRDPCAEEVAVYTFREYTGPMPNATVTTMPHALVIPPRLPRTSTRHGKQRSEYTLCARKVSSDRSLDSHVFADHEEAINIPGFIIEGEEEIDVADAGNAVAKYTMPARERGAALAYLAEKGKTRRELFTDDVDGLLEDLWHEVFAANQQSSP